MLKLRLSLTTAIALCAFQAHAAVDDAGAAQLTQQLTSSLQSMRGIELSGTPQVKPDGDAFAVTLPVLSYKDPKGEFSVVMPSVPVRMTPSSETNYKYTATLPSPFLTFNDNTGVPRGNVTAGEHQISGEWNAHAHFFPTSTNVLKQITITDTKNAFSGVIAELGAVNQMVAGENGLFTAQGSLNMRGIKFAFTDSKSGEAMRVLLDAVGMTSSATGLDLAAAERLREQTREQLQQGKPDAGAILNRLGDYMGASSAAAGDTQLGFTLNNLDLTIVKPGTQGEPARIKLPLVSLTGTSATDASTQLSNMVLKYEHTGLSVSPMESRAVAELLPAAVKVDFTLANLPTAELLRTAGQAVSAAMSKPGENAPAPQATPASSYRSALELMEKSQTALNINTISFSTHALNGLTQGSIKASQASPIGAVGTIDTRITGLTELLAKLAQSPAAAGSKPDEMAQGAVMALTMLQMQGQAVQGATPSAYTYKLELTPAAEVKMNGNMMFSLAGMSVLPDAASPAPSVKGQPRTPVETEDAAPPAKP